MTLASPKTNPYRAATLWMLVIFGATLAIYYQSFTFGFVNYDDNTYVYDNPDVLAGLSWEGVRWAFEKPQYGNYDPMMWLSFMATIEFAGNSPAVHHIINVILHACNSVLLFLLLRGWTGANGKSAVVALLFALHPLHVESVAWISSRKDVLSGFFAFIALGMYTQYTRTKSWRSYVGAILLFIAGILSKPTLVMFPAVLLLLDWWPLKRTGEIRRVLVEKVPILAVCAGVSVATLIGQNDAGILRTDTAFPLAVRITTAAVSYCVYVLQTLWPEGLAPSYPHTGLMPPFIVWMAASAALAATTVYAVRARNSQPYFVVGWLWFLGMLAPVIGLIQIGLQVRADRYTYLPLIGVFIIAAWGGSALVAKRKVGSRTAGAIATAAIALYALMAYVQIGHWRDSESLWEYTIKVSPENAMAYQNLGVHYVHTGRIDKAQEALERALELSDVNTHTKVFVGGPTLHSLGAIAMARQDYGLAAQYFGDAAKLQPGNADTIGVLGDALMALGKFEEAEREFKRALELDPEQAASWHSLAVIDTHRGHAESAVEHAARAVELEPDNSEYHYRLGLAELMARRPEQALQHLDESLALDPGFPLAVELRNAIIGARGQQ
jgi:protein O-mannosyl-transferase